MIVLKWVKIAPDKLIFFLHTELPKSFFGLQTNSKESFYNICQQTDLPEGALIKLIIHTVTDIY